MIAMMTMVTTEIYRRRHGRSPATVRPHREDARVRAITTRPPGRRCPSTRLLPASLHSLSRHIGRLRLRQRRGNRCSTDRLNVVDDEDDRQQQQAVVVSVISHRPAVAGQLATVAVFHSLHLCPNEQYHCWSPNVPSIRTFSGVSPG